MAVPTGSEQTILTYSKAEHIGVFVEHVSDGLTSATEIAAEMSLSKGYISKLAAKAESLGMITVDQKGKYHANY